MMFIGWPPGTVATNISQARLYIRDPRGQMVGSNLLGTWARNPALPRDALDTGYRYGTIKLYFAPSDQDHFAYLIGPRDSERWPRSDPPIGCL
jgi:hypothetical protein